MLYQIYLVTNIITNKKYIGQTSVNNSYIHRFQQHVNESRYNISSKCIFHRAIRKYGRESFKLELIEDNIDEDKIDYKEMQYIEYYNTYYLNGNGYNMTFGGQGIHGYHHTQETLNKLSKKVKKYWLDLKINCPNLYNQICISRSVRLKGKLKSDETRKKLSVAAKNRFKNNPGTFKGKKHSEESKKKIAEANGCKVAMIDIDTNNVLKIFVSATEATKFLMEKNITSNKYANSRILEICNGNGNTAYGYKWRRVEK